MPAAAAALCSLQEVWNRLAMKGAETKVLPALALAASLYLIYNAATADAATWSGARATNLHMLGLTCTPPPFILSWCLI